MAKQALIEQRPWLLASIVAATAYFFLNDNPIGEGTWGILLKGAGVALLALYALLRVPHDRRGIDGALLVLALALAALVQKLTGVGLLIGTPLVSFLLSGQAQIALYAGFLGAMAAAAWMSHYPRYRVGTGAVLFVVSDWLIFSRMGAYDLAPLPDLLIWPLYYAGQMMIATGIVQCLRGEQPVK